MSGLLLGLDHSILNFEELCTPIRQTQQLKVVSSTLSPIQELKIRYPWLPRNLIIFKTHLNMFSKLLKQNSHFVRNVSTISSQFWPLILEIMDNKASVIGCMMSRALILVVLHKLIIFEKRLDQIKAVFNLFSL